MSSPLNFKGAAKRAAYVYLVGSLTLLIFGIELIKPGFLNCTFAEHGANEGQEYKSLFQWCFEMDYDNTSFYDDDPIFGNSGILGGFVMCLALMLCVLSSILFRYNHGFSETKAKFLLPWMDFNTAFLLFYILGMSSMFYVHDKIGMQLKELEILIWTTNSIMIALLYHFTIELFKENPDFNLDNPQCDKELNV